MTETRAQLIERVIEAVAVKLCHQCNRNWHMPMRSKDDGSWWHELAEGGFQYCSASGIRALDRSKLLG